MDALRKKHMDVLKEGVAAMHTEDELTDVEVEVSCGHVFRCHRVLLAAVSPYFKAMFSSGMRESQEPRIKLEDLSQESMEKFLNFIYTGRVEKSPDEATELVRLGALFQVDCIQEHGEDILLDQLCTENCLEFYRFSCLYNCTALQQKAWAAILDDFNSIWPTSVFDKLTLEEVISVIRDDSLVTADEETVCDAALKWINAEYSKRHTLAYSIFRYIRLPHVSPEYLVNKLSKTECLTQSPDCRKLLDEAVQFHLLPSRQLDFSGGRTRYRDHDELEEVLLVITEDSSSHGVFCDSNWHLLAFSFKKRRWFTLAAIPESESPGSEFAVCSHGYDLYLSGGTHRQATMVKFISGRNVWSTCPGQMKNRRIGHCMVSVGEALYCLGGRDASGAITATVEKYSVPSQKWTLVGALCHPVHSATTAVCSENILIFGGIGEDQGDQSSMVQSYHTRLDRSEVISNLPFVPERPLSITIGSTIYVVSTGLRGSSIVKLKPDFGFEDVGFDFDTDKAVIGLSHHNGHLILLMGMADDQAKLNGILRVNVTTSKAEYLMIKGETMDKVVHACNRTFINQGILYPIFGQTNDKSLWSEF